MSHQKASKYVRIVLVVVASLAVAFVYSPALRATAFTAHQAAYSAQGTNPQPDFRDGHDYLVSASGIADQQRWHNIATFGLDSDGWVYDVAVTADFTDSRTMFAATYSGLFRTTDGGRTWKRLGGIGMYPVGVVAVSPNYRDDKMVLAGKYGGDIYRSSDGGETWTVSHPGGEQISDIAFSPQFASDRTIIVGTWNGQQTYAPENSRLFRSTDAGKSWQVIETESFSWNDWSIRSVAFSPSYSKDRTIFAIAYAMLIYTSNNGATWEIVNSYADVFVPPTYADDKTIYVVNDSPMCP